MRGQHFPHFADSEDDRAIEILLFEMGPHVVHQFFPEFFPTFFVDADITDHGILLFSWRNKDQNGVATGGLLHSQLKELSFRPGEGVAFKFPPLNKNADLPGTFSFRFLDRLDDAVVIEPAKETMRSHFCYQLPLAPPPPLEPPPPLNPLEPPPLEDQPPDDQPPPPQLPETNGPPTPV